MGMKKEMSMASKLGLDPLFAIFVDGELHSAIRAESAKDTKSFTKKFKGQDVEAIECSFWEPWKGEMRLHTVERNGEEIHVDMCCGGIIKLKKIKAHGEMWDVRTCQKCRKGYPIS